MITRSIQNHPSITRERVDKALSNLYLTDANTNISRIRYADRKPIGRIRCLSFAHEVDAADGHTLPRPSFDRDVRGRLSEFKDIGLGHAFSPTWSTHWLQLNFKVPAEWQEAISKGEARPHLLFDSNCEAAVFREDGLILQGLTGGDAGQFRGNRRCEFLITPDLVSPVTGDVTLFIEVACNTLFGLGKGGFINPPDAHGSFSLATCELALLDLKAERLFWHFVILRDLTEAAPKGCYLAERANLMANSILNAIDRRDPSTFDAAIALAEEHVLALEAAASTDSTHALTPKVWSVGHCHIDNVWLWFEEETKRKVARSWSSQLRYQQHHDSDFTFVASQAVQYQYLLENHPRLFNGPLKEGVRSGRFVPVGGSWVEPDTNVPSGESLIRQILYGSALVRDVLLPELQQAEKLRHPTAPSSSTSGHSRRFPHGDGVFWLPDSFGYSPQLPQILRQCGLRYFLTQKLSWSLINKPEHSSFWWKGLDDSCVLTHFPPADDYNAAATVESVMKTASNNKDAGRVSSSLMVYGNGDGGGGPNLPMFQQLKRMGAKPATRSSSAAKGEESMSFKRLPTMPEVIHGSPRQFFDDLASEVGRSPWGLTEWKGELYLELHQGTLTSQAATKKANRECETTLHDAELLQALAALLATKGNATSASESADIIRRSWHEVLKNQFHDALPGSSIQQVYTDMAAGYKRVLADLDALSSKLLSKVSASESPSDSKSWLLWNTSAAPRTELIELPFKDGEGSYLQSVALLPYSSKQVKQLTRSEAASLPNFQAVPPALPRLLSASPYCSTHAAGERSCGWEEISSMPPVSLRPQHDKLRVKVLTAKQEAGAGVGQRGDVIVENGIYRVVIDGRNGQILSLLDYRQDGPPQEQDIIIAFNDPLVRFETAVDWRASHTLLKVEFPISPSVWRGATHGTYEVAFGCAQRPIHASSSRDMAQFEVAGHRWADLSSHSYGVALLNDSKYGHAAMRDGVMALSLLRSPKAPDPDCDMGDHHRFTYALLPHAGHVCSAESWSMPSLGVADDSMVAPRPSVVHAGLALNSPLRRLEANFTEPESPAELFFCVTEATSRKLSGNVILDTVKLPEWQREGAGGKPLAVVLRLYEAYGNASTVDVRLGLQSLAIARVRGTNVLEELPGKEGLPLEGSLEEDAIVEASPDTSDALLASAPAQVQAAFSKVGGPSSSQASLVGVRPDAFTVHMKPFQIATFIVELV